MDSARRWSPIIGGCIGVAFLWACAGCGKQDRTATISRPNHLEVHTLTWKEYDESAPVDKAVYVFDGESMGRGDDGFCRVSAKARQMPPGSVLLVLPDYNGKHRGSTAPLRIHGTALEDTVQQRRVAIAVAQADGVARNLKGEIEMHTLTWTDYDGESDSDRAVYVLDGKPVGRGEEGFHQVLAHFEEITPGSVLLVYPDYSDKREPPRCRPYLFYGAALGDAAKQRSIVVALSPSMSVGPRMNQPERPGTHER